MTQLRPYQQAAVEAVYEHLRTRDDNPAVVLPTAAGKSWVIAQLVKDTVLRWNGRVLVLAHVKELLEQNAEKIRRLCPEVPIGIYSAGLNRRETDKPVIVAGIQSVYRRACELDAFDLAIVDEAHLIPPDGEGMYRTFLAEAKVVNPHLRVVGLTATPFRLASGPICTPEGILNHICYEVRVHELIRDGYLCPLVTKAGVNKADFGRLHVRAGEFVADEVELLMDDDRLVAAGCAEIVAYTHDRQSVLVFTSGVKHGKHVARVLAEMSGQEVGFLDGQTPAAERAELIARFRREPLPGDLFGHRLPPLKYLVNVNVLTTGFDAPNIDCVAILRPTMSPGLWYQCVGRGFRLHPGKQNCLVLDFGGNALRHGPVDQLKMPEAPGRGSGEAPAKECPECHAVIVAGYARCPECGHQFPPPERQRHDARAATTGVLSGQVTDTEYEVLDIRYSVHTKRDAPPDAPRSMRVEYRIGQFTWVSEWVCFEHGGYARWKAEQWWRRRSPDPVPETAERAVEIAEAGGVAWTEKIVVRTVAGEKYDRIVGYTLGPKPEPVPIEETAGDLADVPF
ncbi:MAG TPA: DEAD/DEAH box helicase family protein [Phycisphaerae bacterium]|nr:DEAD/DEAH box helicase family protein [Phycisphaerae bacterium]